MGDDGFYAASGGVIQRTCAFDAASVYAFETARFAIAA
jgi:hypothetical protein